jgi:hypothetical protein
VALQELVEIKPWRMVVVVVRGFETSWNDNRTSFQDYYEQTFTKTLTV